MSVAHAQQDWSALFDEAEKRIPSAATGSPAATTVGDGPPVRKAALAECIDHTLLKLDATGEQIDALCDEASRFKFKSVCVRLPWVSRAEQRLQGGSVAVACVIGFHEGTYTSDDKVQEARSAVDAGATELDMVMNHVWLREQRYPEVFADVAAVRQAAPSPIVLKVILETSLLSPREIVAGCKIAEVANADFVKTSTGFDGPGATVSNVRLMRNVVDRKMKVKASGGVRSLNDCLEMIKAGAERIGTSGGVKIMQEIEATSTGSTKDDAAGKSVQPDATLY